MKRIENTRQAERFRLEVPVTFDVGTGMTKDVSRSGIYFYTERTFLPGMPLSFTLELDHVFPGEPVHLHCRGEVVRVEKSGERSGVAASIREFWSAV